MDWDSHEVQTLIGLSLFEDHARSDVTSRALVPATWRAHGEIHAKQYGVVAGLPFAEQIFKALDPKCHFRALVHDGKRVRPGQKMAVVTGRARLLLSAERPAINALQHLSGIATYTARQRSRLGRRPTKLLDTRKTMPGWRRLEKYAVACGGGTNHRMSLDEAVLVKDNHLRMSRLAGDDWIARIEALRRRHPKLSIQVEIQDEQDLRDVLRLKPNLALIDNVPIPSLRRIIRTLRKGIPGVQIEVSGGVRPEHLAPIAALGVERISMGRLTHSAPSFDCSFEITDVHPR